MKPTIVQVYEIQTPDEARAMIELGVDRIGSVIVSPANRHDPLVRQTVDLVRQMGATSSLIPLYTNPDAILETLDYHRPHVVHFCDTLDGRDSRSLDDALELQAAVKGSFPEIQIMRSIPIAPMATEDGASILALARQLEPLSDYFLTDTVIVDPTGEEVADQPVGGFVGITGQTCDWSVAARLVAASRIPVILAGGISPENVVDGIRRVRPFGVDSCTLTNAVDDECQVIRFQKDPLRVETLVAETRRADVELQTNRANF